MNLVHVQCFQIVQNQNIYSRSVYEKMSTIVQMKYPFVNVIVYLLVLALNLAISIRCQLQHEDSSRLLKLKFPLVIVFRVLKILYSSNHRPTEIYTKSRGIHQCPGQVVLFSTKMVAYDF